MKKIAYVLCVLFGVAIFSTSCQKCVTCTYDISGTEYTSGEICGTSSEIDDVIEQWENTATTAGVTASCN
jgi:hypothetical protein